MSRVFFSKILQVRLALLVCIFIGLPPLQAVMAADTYNDEKDLIEVSGFARLVGGYLDDPDLEFQQYSNTLSFGEQSLFALRADINLTNDVKIVSQGVLHSSDNRESEIQWLYLQYQVNRALSVRLGKQRMPFFDFSETNDVGFAYPWITPPLQVYSEFLFFDIDGALASYEFSSKNISGAFEAYWGEYEGNLSTAETTSYTKLENNSGLILKLNYDNFNLRASHHFTNIDISLTPIIEFRKVLTDAGFVESANALSLAGKLQFSQISLSYDSFTYFFKSELTRYNSEFLVFPDAKSGYVLAGYNFFPFSAHITYAKSEVSYDRPENIIPKGLDPQIDALSFSYDQVLANLNVDSMESFTVGIRYDWNDNIAFKAEYSKLNGNDNSRGLFTKNSAKNPQNEAKLIQVAIEWVF